MNRDGADAEGGGDASPAGVEDGGCGGGGGRECRWGSNSGSNRRRGCWLRRMGGGRGGGEMPFSLWSENLCSVDLEFWWRSGLGVLMLPLTN